MADAGPFQIDDELAEFLAGPVAIVVATCDRAGVPHVVRGYAARASQGKVGVCVPVVQAQGILQDVRDNGAIAVVFSRVHDFKTYQLKGDDAEIGAPAHADAPHLEAYCRDFQTELEQAGVPAAVPRGFRFRDFVEIRFTPTSAFLQTPGPNAGEAVTR